MIESTKCDRYINSMKIRNHSIVCLPLIIAAGVVSGAGAEVTNLGSWTSETRKQDRDAELWRHYQHGVVDHFATPFRFEDLLGPDQSPDKWLDRDQPVDNPYKESTQAAVRCAGSDSIELARPVPLPIEQVRGKRIRIFFWMKGEDAGAKNNTWHCPDMDVIIRDARRVDEAV